MPPIILKDRKTVTHDPRLDGIYQLDWRSLDYPITASPNVPTDLESRQLKTKLWIAGSILDQGPDGACEGFSSAGDLLAEPQVITEWNGMPVDDKFAKEQLYWEFQRNDPWAGGSYPGAAPTYEGTSTLANAQTMKKMGFWTSYYWGLTTQQVALGVAYDGPCISGIKWYHGMFSPDKNGFVNPTGAVVGRHAILTRGVTIQFKTFMGKIMGRTWEHVDLDKSFFTWRNSWGPYFGLNGDCRITFRNYDKLLKSQGEALFPVRAVVAPTKAPEPAKKAVKARKVTKATKTSKKAPAHVKS